MNKRTKTTTFIAISIILLLIIIVLVMFFKRGVKSTTTSDIEKVYDGNSKILIVYFSLIDNVDVNINDLSNEIVSQSATEVDGKKVGNANALALFSQKAVGGDIVSIKVSDLYSGDFDDISERSTKEMNENALPELSTDVDNFEEYDTIILIYPIWWGGLPRPVVSFLNNYDFNGKTIIPITTSVSSGLGSSVSEIKSACPNAEVTNGLGTSGGTAKGFETEVADFLKNILLE